MSCERFLEKVYNELTENIKSSETKNAILITLDSTLIVLGGNIIFNNSILSCYRVLFSIFVLALGIPLMCAVFSYRAMTGSEKKLVKKIYMLLDRQNHIPYEPKKYMYFAYIHRYFADNPIEYLQNVMPSAEQGKGEHSLLLYQMAIQIVDFSGIAYRKFILFNIAIKMEFAILGCFGVIFCALLIF